MILFVTGEYPPDVGGVGDYTARLRDALKPLGWESAVLTRSQVRRWDVRSLIWLLRTAPRSGIVHIQFQSGAFDLLGDVCLMPTLLRRFRPTVRTVTTFHDLRVPYLFPRAGALREKAVRLLARSSDVVIAADERDLQSLQGVSRRQYHVPIGSNVPCAPPAGFDREAFRLSLGLDASQLAIVYFGVVNAGNSLRVVFDTLERLRCSVPGVRLLLLGGGIAEKAPTAIQPGWLPPSKLSAYFLAGDVALLPYGDGASARRGSLLACAEHGLPIVTTTPVGTEVAPFVEAVVNEPDQLSGAVLRMAADSTKRRADSRTLAETVRWPRIARDHGSLYAELLHSSP